MVAGIVAGALTVYLGSYGILYYRAMPRPVITERIDPDGSHVMTSSLISICPDLLRYAESDTVDSCCYVLFWPVHRVHLLLGGKRHGNDP